MMPVTPGSALETLEADHHPAEPLTLTFICLCGDLL